MKKSVKKFWGLGLIVIILSTLFVAGAPVSAANPLQWNTEAIPGPPGNVLLDGSNITGLAVGPDGTTIYAVTGGTLVYKSTNAGVMWSSINNTAGMSPGTAEIDADLVAVAADDEDVIVIVDIAAEDVRVSTTGGTMWSDLDTTAFHTGVSGTITGIDVSSEVSGIRYAAVSVDDGEIWTRKFGSSWEEWKEASSLYNGYAGADDVWAVKFSPNFSSDRTMTAVTANAAKTSFQLMVYTSTPKWNVDAGLVYYPAEIYDYLGNSITDATAASISLAPDYPGGGEYESIAFIGLSTTAGTNAGVFRMDDYISSCIKRSIDVVSVAYDGEVCVAGATDARVWRSENPLDSSPSFLGNNSMKGPGGSSDALVGFAGTNVVAGTSGDESAFAVSVDNGRSFSDISLIDTDITYINDIAVSPDGTKIYMVTSDSDSTPDISLFRFNAGWQRVLSYPTADDDYIVRVSPDNFDAVYVADTGSAATKIFRSTAGGDTRWYTRSGTGLIDLAVESDNVLYAANAGTKTVSKSTNGGAYFGDGVNTKLITGNVATIKVLSEDNIIVSSNAGSVSYSTDGNESWMPMGPPASGTAQVTATGLTEGSYVYVSIGASTYRWTMGQSPVDPWANISAVAPFTILPAGSTIVGMDMFGSTLYAATANVSSTPSTFMRNTMPSAAEGAPMFWSTPDGGGADTIAGDISRSPRTLRLSSTESYVKVWAAATTSMGEGLYSFMDTLILTTPQNSAPEQGALIPLNVKSNLPYNITFMWSRPSLAQSYKLFIALDPMFSQTVVMVTGIGSTPAPTQAYTLTGTDLAKLTPGTTYYWAVSVGTPLSSSFSAMPGWEFTLQAGEASVPIIESPVSGSTDVGEKPAFSWTPVTNTTKYKFQLSEGTAFAVPMVDEETMTTAIQINVALEAGKTYFWRVKALEPVAGDWSTVGSFTVAVPAEPEPPPITVTQQAPPSITITQPANPPAVTYQPPAEEKIAPAYIWAIIIIGAVLVIAVIVLIVRTRRSV